MKFQTKRADQNHQDWFHQLASDLMNNWSLVTGSATYRLTEIEFYFFSSDHQDSYVHTNTKQLTNGEWYFHGSGLDITFGDKHKNEFGGILVRGIKEITTNEYIDGSLNVVAQLFKDFGSVADHTIHLGLKKVGHNFEQPIRCPRVGLNQEKNKTFFDRPYRFVTEINPEHKFKDKTKVAIQMKNDGLSLDHINSLFGYKIIQ